MRPRDVEHDAELILHPLARDRRHADLAGNLLPVALFEDIGRFRPETADDVDRRVQDRVHHLLVFFARLLPVRERVPAGVVELDLVAQNPFPDVTCRVDDEAVVFCADRRGNRVGEVLRLVGLDVVNVEIEVRRIDRRAPVLGVDERDPAGRADQAAREPERRVGLPRPRHAHQREFDRDFVPACRFECHF